MSDPDNSQKDTYFVAVKLFLEKNGNLFIFKDKFGAWDLPGGRIKKQEFETPLEDVLARKIAEELGDELKYSVDRRPEVLMRHERVEAAPGNPTVRIFGVGYRAQWISGEPKLSDAHTEMKWVDIKTFKPEDYFTGGWLKGIKEYLELRDDIAQ
jgi:8-oxo-dGTP pyrophosphatase MutT (NUDIX family)